MTREIRITIDDDEIFERMRTRKQELDLSWEEVIHRGLRRDNAYRTVHSPAEEHPPRTPDPLTDPEAFADALKRRIQGQVRESLSASFGGDLDAEMESLTAA